MILFITSFFFSFFLLYYLATILQLSSYKPLRAILHFPKLRWHFYYFLTPFLLFVITCDINAYLPILTAFAYCVALFFWAKKLDKKLVFTARIKRLFLFNFASAIILIPIHFYLKSKAHVLDILLLAFVFSYICEYFISRSFYKKAYKKISDLSDCKVILITASFGKTSIKHYLASILATKFRVHFAKGSVNTLLGIIKDINENLDANTQFLIVEAGARKKGDILEITKLVRPHYVIIGEIGTAHLEYFKSIENTRLAKLEALQSPRLKKAITHTSTGLKDCYDSDLSNVLASLEALSFTYQNDDFTTPLLGSFNASNLAACIKLAKELGFTSDELKKILKDLKAVDHRLQILQKEPKFIIDDGFNGNFNGMSDSYLIVKNYQKGKKVLVSPGIIEANDELNIRLCDIINECFDLAIITSETNAKIYEKHLKIEKIILKDKSQLITTLAKMTSENDLILFSNDAPNHI